MRLSLVFPFDWGLLQLWEKNLLELLLQIGASPLLNG